MNTKLLSEFLEKHHVSKTYIAKEIGCSKQALYYKLRNGSFSLDDAKTITGVLRLTDDEFKNIFLS